MTARHLLAVSDLSRDEATAILDDADRFAQALVGREVKKLPTLRGRTVITMFYENSTRTRVSFEVVEQVDERRRRQRVRVGILGGQRGVAARHRADPARQPASTHWSSGIRRPVLHSCSPSGPQAPREAVRG